MNTKQLTKPIRHNQGLAFSSVLSAAMLLWLYGCPSRVPSLTDAHRKCTRGQLQIELDSLIKEAELRFADLDRQDAVKQAIANSAIDWIKTGNVNPLGVVTLITGILGVGAVIDNRRKDGIINGNNRKKKHAPQTNPTT
jgi:hypothetical protein